MAHSPYHGLFVRGSGGGGSNEAVRIQRIYTPELAASSSTWGDVVDDVSAGRLNSPSRGAAIQSQKDWLKNEIDRVEKLAMANASSEVKALEQRVQEFHREWIAKFEDMLDHYVEPRADVFPAKIFLFPSAQTWE